MELINQIIISSDNSVTEISQHPFETFLVFQVFLKDDSTYLALTNKLVGIRSCTATPSKLLRLIIFRKWTAASVFL